GPGAGGADLLPAGAVELPRLVFGFERFSVRGAMRSAEEDDAIANGVVRHREHLPRVGRVRRVDLAPVRAVPDPGVVEERDFAAERRLGVAAAEEHDARAERVVDHAVRGALLRTVGRKDLRPRGAAPEPGLAAIVGVAGAGVEG